MNTNIQESSSVIYRRLDILPTFAQLEITNTDMYHLIIARCNDDAGDIEIDGIILFMNPYGHLEGQSFGNWMVSFVQYLKENL